MLTVRNLTFSYAPRLPDERPPQVLKGCSFALDHGASLAIMGATGAGKSTLAHVVAGLAPRYTGGSVTGLVRVGGVDVIAGPPDPGIVGVLFQDATTQLFNTSVEDEVAWGLEALGLPASEIGQRVRGALARFELAAVAQRAPWALSGGQQKRLALAAVWAMQPKFLVLDEPLGGLDLEGRAEVIEVIEELRRTGTELLLLSLRPEVAQQAAEISLLADAQMTPPTSVKGLRDLMPRLIETGVLYPSEMWPSLGPREPSGTGVPALEMRNLHFHYSDGTPVLRGIDLIVPDGQFIAIVGRNGAGKSTLVRHFNGLLRPTAGEVWVRGEVIANRPTGVLAREVAYLFQRPEKQLFASTVREELVYGPTRLGLPAIAARLDETLTRFGLMDMADMPPALLGYGDQRTVTLAVLAMLDAPVVILDEPMVGLDGQGLARLMDWLVDLRCRGATVVLVTHEMELARRADRIMVLAEGRIRADGKPATVLAGAENRMDVV